MSVLDLRPGTVLAIRIPWTPVFHVGLLSDYITHNGVPTVISNSQRTGGVSEEPLTSFGDATHIRVLGYWSDLEPAEVMYRARQLIGTKWSLANWNCEHFVRVAHAVKSESPQLKAGLTVAAVTVLMVGALTVTQRR